jgi:phosphoribosylcarboxyaminoimidazole (NCAIR) mutase
MHVYNNEPVTPMPLIVPISSSGVGSAAVAAVAAAEMLLLFMMPRRPSS